MKSYNEGIFFHMLNGKFLGQTTANLIGQLSQWPDSSVNYLQFSEA